MRDEATKQGYPPIREAIWQYFITKSINNLHVVLAMSPVGDTLRTRCRNFPGLVNNCSIDWFMAWPKQALEAVATVFLGHEDVSHKKELATIVYIVSLIKRYIISGVTKPKPHNCVPNGLRIHGTPSSSSSFQMLAGM